MEHNLGPFMTVASANPLKVSTLCLPSLLHYRDAAVQFSAIVGSFPPLAGSGFSCDKWHYGGEFSGHQPLSLSGAYLPSHLPRRDLSCKTVQLHLLTFKNTFPARHRSKIESGRCETEAVVGDVPLKMKVEDVRTKLSRETSLKK